MTASAAACDSERERLEAPAIAPTAAETDALLDDNETDAVQTHKPSPPEDERQDDPDQDGVVVYSPPTYWADSRLPTWLQRLITDAFVFVIIHYNLWLVPFLVLFYFLLTHGYALVVVALVAIYLPSYLDGSQLTAGGRQWDWFRTLPAWHMANNFLGLTIVREVKLQEGKSYIFGYHPHGIIVLSRVATYGGNWETLFPGNSFRILGASSVFQVPLGRELCLWLGGVDACRSTAEKVLQSGRSICVYPGGVPEIFVTDPKSKENVLILKKRLGFVKLAIRQGADLVPTFVFGEKWLYNVWRPSKKVSDLVWKVLKIPLILFWGRFLWMPIDLPKEKPYGVVYGKPIAITQKAEPTDEEVQAIHAQYVAEIERIFEQYKKSYGYDDDEKLVIT